MNLKTFEKQAILIKIRFGMIEISISFEKTAKLNVFHTFFTN